MSLITKKFRNFTFKFQLLENRISTVGESQQSQPHRQNSNLKHYLTHFFHWQFIDHFHHSEEILFLRTYTGSHRDQNKRNLATALVRRHVWAIDCQRCCQRHLAAEIGTATLLNLLQLLVKQRKRESITLGQVSLFIPF